MIVACGGQVADALDAAHAEGVVHRDVKPSNILLMPSGFAYLVDFGIARAVLDTATAVTATGAAVGTMLYMAPEQFEGTRIDGRVDVYALACVFHELITGEPPFRGASMVSLMHAHLNTPPPRAAAIRPGIPAGVDGVIARGMAKRPQDRFSTAGELSRAVRDTLGPTTGSGPYTAPVTAPAPPRRRPALIVAGVAAAVVVVVTAGLVAAAVARNGTPVAGPPEVTGTTAPAATTTPEPTVDSGSEADRALIAAVDPAILQGCRSTDPDQFAVGVTAAVECRTSEPEPATYVNLRRLASRAALDDQLARESATTATGAADFAQNCRDGALVDVWDRGRIVCTPGQQYELRIAWTFDDELVVAYAEGSAAGFPDWWLRSGSVLR